MRLNVLLLVLLALVSCAKSSGERLPNNGFPAEGTLPFPDAFLTQQGIDKRIGEYITAAEIKYLYDDQRWKNIMAGIGRSVTLPKEYVLITTEQELRELVSGKSYYVRGDITVTKQVDVPSNVDIYIEGRIYKEGKIESAQKNADIIFSIKDKENVNMYGINHPKICSNTFCEAFVVNNSKSVRIDGFYIADTWQGVVCRGSARKVVVINNYIRKTVQRNVWMLAAYEITVVHNVLDSPTYDGIDFDAYSKNCVAFENFIIAAARWAGFVEEGAKYNYLIKNICVMDDSQNKKKWQMGFADNGTTQGVFDRGGLTEDNYFIENLTIQPSIFNRSYGNGGAFAKPGAGKGMTYFWGNVEVGCSPASGLIQAEWLNQTPDAGSEKIAFYDKLYN